MAYIHHVQLSTRHGLKYVEKIVEKANFTLFAERCTRSVKQWAVKSGSTIFVINQPGEWHYHDDISLKFEHFNDDDVDSRSHKLIKIGNASNHNGEGSYQSKSDVCFALSNKDQNIDSVFNIAFEVVNVEQFVKRAESNGARVLCQPTVIHTERGKVVMAAVYSCVGNVVHTILNTSEYGGVFLPGFSESNYLNTHKNDKRNLSYTTHIDHVTLATDIGESSDVMDWYERCLGMKRFKLSRDDSDSKGLVVEGQNVGLRIKAMEYWHCAETGIAMPHTDNRHPKAKFVIAEALPGQGRNQVETFLQEHGGPGIQHIALYAPNIIDTVQDLKKNGMDFMQIPDSYYSEIEKSTEMLRVGENSEDLKQLGILLDAESFGEDDEEDKEKLMSIQESEKDVSTTAVNKHSYLMQIFTKPIFDRNTFFLEFIQRCGATGFGAGNIKALWKAVDHYMKDKTSQNI